MKQIIQKTYEGNNLFFPNASVIGLFALNAGTIKTVRVKINAPTPSGATRFNLKKNGTAIFDDELEIASGQSSISITDLDIEISRFDVLVLSLETVPEGGVLTPIALQIETEETVLVSKSDIYDAAKQIFVEGENITITEDDEALTLTVSGEEGGGGAEYLDDLEDVVLAGETDGDLLGFVDDEWVNLIPSEVKEILSLENVTNDAQLKRSANDWSGFTEKTTLHNDDLILIEDSENAGAKKKVKKSNIGGGGGSYDGGRPTDTFGKFYFREDFIGGDYINGNRAARWNEIGSAVPGPLTGEANHPGIVQISVANTTLCGLMLTPANSGFDAFVPADMFEINWIFRINTVDSDLMFRCGLGANSHSNPGNNGIYVEKLTTDTQFFGVTRAASSQNRTSGLGTVNASTWYKVRIRRVDASTIGFTINNGSEVTATSTIPTVAITPFISATSASGTKTVDVDFFDLSLIGLTRF